MDKDKVIIAIPSVIATMEIRIIGFEKELLLPLIIFLAKKSSKFKREIALMGYKFSQMLKQMGLWNILLWLLFIHSALACAQVEEKSELTTKIEQSIVLGNEQMNQYLPLLQNKKVAFVGNHTSVIQQTHIVDSLLALNIQLIKVFSPEHGFRGIADAGEKVKSEVDQKTGLPIISLYGSNKKPTQDQLKGVEIILFDIQDVGARFYTYISTLHYVMEAAAEAGIPIVLLDRPNPNGHYVDGPILEKEFQSFVGLHEVPVVHGMTIGEYAQMINGEGWLAEGLKCELKVIECLNYDHQKAYELAIAPSPNLPNMKAIYWYPSICFFEGTPISVGRGTDKPFQQIGHPDLNFDYTFTPKPSFGAKNPKLNQKQCKGIDLSLFSEEELKNKAHLDLAPLLSFYKQYPNQAAFFTNFFNLLAGNASLQESIKAAKTESQIRAMWKEDLIQFKQKRKKYLLYPDFE